MKYSLLYKTLGYSFHNTNLLKEALTRRSALEERHPDAANGIFQFRKRVAPV
jgi:dsRNA-specific ribonuclease